MYAVLGASGYVGAKFGEVLDSQGLAWMGLSRAEVDYSKVGVLREWLRAERPRYLVNCAGYTGKPNVDACEEQRAECLFGNAVLPGRIREACEAEGVPWGHVSSGCIYSGQRPGGGGWLEEDEPNFSFRSPPCSFYSGSKALGEEVLEGAERCHVWRLRIPFDHEDSPRNYLVKVMRYARLLDAENSISHLRDFVEACLSCVENEVPFGIYNVTNPGSVSTRQVTEWMREEGVSDKTFDFFEGESEFMRFAAVAPRSNCLMDSSKLAGAGVLMRPVEEAVRDSLRRMQGNLVD